MAWSLATPHPPLPCDAALAHAALLRTLVQVAVQQELTLPVWQAVRGRVVSQADGQAVVLFQLNGVTYVAEPQPATATTAGGWLVTCPQQADALLGVRRFQDALLVLVGALAFQDLVPDLPPGGYVA